MFDNYLVTKAIKIEIKIFLFWFEGLLKLCDNLVKVTVGIRK